MSEILHVSMDDDIKNSFDLLTEFKKEVTVGLGQVHKSVPSKYLYDDKGAEIFNQITRHPDYYLTNCEIEILDTYKENLMEYMGASPFNLIELGPGEGIKTNILLEQFLSAKATLRYIPVDINEQYLRHIVTKLKKSYPTLSTKALHADYFDGLNWITENSETPNLILFLGSNIGNFNRQMTNEFLTKLRLNLKNGDYVLIGFDLCKSIQTILRAYDDTDGITREFNLNLLRRMNRELGADFNTDHFSHYPFYNPITQSMESYLISGRAQQVNFKHLNKYFDFQAHEPIHLEYSRKFTLEDIYQLALANGFEYVTNFIDRQNYFADSLWRVQK